MRKFVLMAAASTFGKWYPKGHELRKGWTPSDIPAIIKSVLDAAPTYAKDDELLGIAQLSQSMVGVPRAAWKGALDIVLIDSRATVFLNLYRYACMYAVNCKNPEVREKLDFMKTLYYSRANPGDPRGALTKSMMDALPLRNIVGYVHLYDEEAMLT